MKDNKGVTILLTLYKLVTVLSESLKKEVKEKDGATELERVYKETGAMNV